MAQMVGDKVHMIDIIYLCHMQVAPERERAISTTARACTTTPETTGRTVCKVCTYDFHAASFSDPTDNFFVEN